MFRLLCLTIFQFLILAQYVWATEEAKGFYGRIDSGLTAPQKAKSMNFKNSLFANIGVGYHFNDIFRTDLNFQYRKLSAQKSLEIKKIENIVIMLNGYFNLTDSMDDFIPYLIAGLGYGRNNLKNFQDNSTNTQIRQNGKSVSNLIWNVGAGGVIKFTKNIGVDLYYKYVDLGTIKGSTTLIKTSTNELTTSNLKLKLLKSNEFGIGIIFNF